MQEEGEEDVNEEEGEPASCPHKRLVWLDGAARTLMSNYRKGWSRYSEFIASDGSGSGGAGAQGQGGAVEGEVAPPRFYTRREAARLMGFPDTFKVDLAFGLAGGATAPVGQKKQQKNQKQHNSESGSVGAEINRGQQGHGEQQEANRFYVQIGNAVCPPIVTAIAAQLLDHCGLRLRAGGGPVSTATAAANKTEPRLPRDCHASLLSLDPAVWGLLKDGGHDAWFEVAAMATAAGSAPAAAACAIRPGEQVRV